jgi:hypothetical protein
LNDGPALECVVGLLGEVFSMQLNCRGGIG